MKSGQSAPITQNPRALIGQLRNEHERLEARLETLDSNAYLTPNEQLERKRVQKLKLRAKDQIQQMMGRLPD